MRVKLSIPEHNPNYSYQYRLTVADMNYGNHMGNDRFLTLAHESRLSFFHTLEMDELKFFGSSLIMADAMIQYKAQGFRGDETTTNIWIENISNYGFDLVYQVIKVKDNKEMARMKTAMLFFDYENQKMVKTPDEFTKRFKSQGANL